MADRIGQQLDNYRLTRLLGAGGFGEVYLAEHLYRSTQVAIKILPQLAQDDLHSFLIEARTFRLKHPNIVQVLDFGVEGRTPFIVMEYAPNGTLRQRHPKGARVLLPTIVSYVKQVASALQYAHEERLVHRDVKPENMLIGGQDLVLLSDFGIATIAHGTSSQSVETMAGTIPYMAPEQIQGHPRPASDQYSPGVVVYEWLCGDRPFHGTLTEVAVQHATMPPPPLQEKVPTISLDVEQVVMTTLAKGPKQRFGSVLAFATAFEQASQVKQPEPVVPVSETTGMNPSQQPTEMATPPIPFPQQVTVGKLPVDMPFRQTVSEVSVDIPDPPHNLESGKIPPVGRSDDEDHPRDPSSLPEGMVHTSLTPQEETAIPSPLFQTEKVLSGSQKTDEKSLLSRSAGQQSGKGIQSPTSRPWYTLGKRDVLAVVLTAGLYQVVLWSSSLLLYLHLSLHPSFVGVLVLLVLLIVTGIIPVVFSKRKGFDGLVPVLLSGLACGILNLFNSIESISYPATTLIALAVQVFFLMLVAATYISIKNRVSGHPREAHLK